MYCRYCGTRLDDGDSFCPGCGERTGLGGAGNNNRGGNRRTRTPKRGRIWLAVCVGVIAGALLGIFGFRLLKGGRAEEEPVEAYYQPFTDEDVLYEEGDTYVGSQLLLTAVPGTPKETIEELVSASGGEVVGYISVSDDYQIEFPAGKTYDELQAIIEEWGRVDAIEDVTLHYAFEEQLDVVAYQGEEWTETGKNDDSGQVWSEAQPDGLNWWAEAVMLPTVWNLDIDYDIVKVGIFDSMFQTDHFDLDGLFVKTWQNPDNVTELYQDAVERSKTDDTVDTGSFLHGTHVAGLIAAQANGRGIVGASQNAALYGYAAHGEAAHKYVSMMACKYAFSLFFENGVKVINISTGMSDEAEISAYLDWRDSKTPDTSVAIREIKRYNDALEAFLKKCLLKYDFLIVKSAGNARDDMVVRNENRDEKHPYSYIISTSETDENRISVPALDIEHQFISGIDDTEVRNHIIVVGSVDLKYTKDVPYCEPSAFSLLDADVYAPGGTEHKYNFWDDSLLEGLTSKEYNILSDIPGNGTKEEPGTSMATPIVSGIAALVWGINPDLTGDEVCVILMNSVRNGPFSDAEVVNAAAAVTAALNSRPGAEEQVYGPAYMQGMLMGYLGEADTASVYDESGTVLLRELEIYENDCSFTEFLDRGRYVLRTSRYPDVPFEINPGEVTYLSLTYTSGTVIDRETEKPIQDVRVTMLLNGTGDTRFSGYTVTTDQNGGFSVFNPYDNNEVTLLFEKEGYSSLKKTWADTILMDAGTVKLERTAEDRDDAEEGRKNDALSRDDSPGAGDYAAIDAVNFPDECFRAYVSEEFDLDGDGTLSPSEIAAVQSIEFDAGQSESLKGLEFFTELRSLDLMRISVTELDVSRNTKLKNLSCYELLLTSLDISRNTELTSLDCSYTPIVELDIRNNPHLLDVVEHGERREVTNDWGATRVRYEIDRDNCLYISSGTKLITGAVESGGTQGTEPEFMDAYEPYASLLDAFYHHMETDWEELMEGDDPQWGVSIREAEGIESEFMSCLYYYRGRDASLSEVGYTMTDLNNDGVPELLVSMDGSVSDGEIVDLYTIIDGEVFHLATSGGRFWYRLMDDQRIWFYASLSAFLHYDIIYDVDASSGVLLPAEVLVSDYDRDSENPYYYSTEDCIDRVSGMVDYDRMRHITNEEAEELQERFEDSVQPLSLTFFSSYNVSSADGRALPVQCRTSYLDNGIDLIYDLSYNYRGDLIEKKLVSVSRGEMYYEKEIYTYDVDGALRHAVSYGGPSEDSSWVTSDDVYIYEDGRLIDVDIHSEGEAHFLKHYNYDENGRVIEMIYTQNLEYEPMTSTVVNSYTYSDDGRLIEIDSHTDRPGSEDTIQVNDYNDRGELCLETYYSNGMPYQEVEYIFSY